MKPLVKQRCEFLSTIRVYSAGLIALMAVLFIGCKSTRHDEFKNAQFPSSPQGVQTDTNTAAPATRRGEPVPTTLILREGDTVRISFPGSPNLNTIQQIRRDGKISLPMVGEFRASGLAPADLEKELVKLYAPQLVTKEVNVTVESSAFFVFVTGAVGRPGRVAFDRPITALEAVIDAGVDYSKANLKDVTVIRRQGTHEERRHLNLKKELQGGGGEPFFLQPSDIIFVRERFTWF
jgi:polysaccharide export outer membrane protein